MYVFMDWSDWSLLLPSTEARTVREVDETAIRDDNGDEIPQTMIASAGQVCIFIYISISPTQFSPEDTLCQPAKELWVE